MNTRNRLILGLALSIAFAAWGFGPAPMSASCQYKNIFFGQTIDETWSAGDCVSSGNLVYDTYLFSGASGQQITATATYTNPGLNPVYVNIQSLDGLGLASSTSTSPVRVTYTLPDSGYYLIKVRSMVSLGYGNYSLSLTASGGACAQGLCLNDGRFQVIATWRKSDGTTGAATPALMTGDTGYFWFFSSDNVEMVVKVLDGRGVNGHFWVFASGLTNVQVDLFVLDTSTHVVKTYQNPLGTAFQPIQDTSAFDGQAPSQNADVTGVWDAVVTVPPGLQQNTTFTLTQTGTSVTGTVALVGDPGTTPLSGTVAGQSFSFTVTDTGSCPGTSTGVAMVDESGTHMSGTYSGSDCEGSFSGTFTATRR
jgi:hypothetical protein